MQWDSSSRHRGNSCYVQPRNAIAYFSIDELVKGGFHSNTSWTESYILRDIRRPQDGSSALENRLLQHHALPQVDARASFIDDIYDSQLGFRYVVKHIPRRFMDSHRDFEVAASYLEQEAIMMQNLHHQHISKLRGTAHGGVEAYYSAGGRRCDAYFLILDRISESMEHRIKRWRRKQARRKLSHQLCGWMSVGGGERSMRGAMTKADQRFYCKRLDVAHQIADALQYMHQQNIAYRNFGIEKVGFNLRNEVQLVELGDAENLGTDKSEKVSPNTSQSSFAPESLKLATDCLTSYSAPEAIEGLALTCKADSYSFSKLFSEILTLIVVRRDSSSRETQAYVSEFQRVARRLPRETLDLLERGANMDPRKRPTLRAFCETIDLARALVGSEVPRRGSSLPLLRRDIAPRSVSMTGSVY